MNQNQTPRQLNSQARLMLASMTASQTSEAVFRMAVAWWLLDVTHSPALFATVIAISNVAMVVTHSTLGWVADHYDRRSVLFLAYAADLAACAAIGGLAGGQDANAALVTLLLVIGTVANAIGGPVHTSIALEECSAEASQEFVRHRTSLSSLTNVSGPVLAGGLLSVLSSPTVILIHALVLLTISITLGLYFLIGRRRSPASDPAASKNTESGTALIFSGLTTLWRIVPERSLCAQSILGNLAIYPLFAVLLPVMIKEMLNQPAWILGVCEAAFGVGAVILSTLVAKPLITRLGRYRAAVLGRFAMLVGVLGLMLGLVPSDEFGRSILTTISCAALALMGGGYSVLNIAVGQARAIATPNAYRNRLISGATALVTSAIPLGSLLGGWMLTNGSVLFALLTVFVVMLLATALLILDRHSRALLSLNNEALKSAYTQYLPASTSPAASDSPATVKTAG